MNKRTRGGRLIAIIGVACLTLVGSVTFADPAQASSPGNMLSPLGIGASTCIYQGYDTYAPNGTHNGTSDYGLDLVTGTCSSTATAGLNAYAPLDGTVYYWQASYGNLCVNTTDGRSYTLTHINASVISGTVTAGALLGTVAAAQPNPSVAPHNNNVAHIHFQIWNTPGCYQASVIPFDSAHNARICGAPDLTTSGTGSNGKWSGTTFTGAGCGGGGSGNVQLLLDSVGQVWAQSTSTLSMGWTQETPPGIKAIASGGGVQMILDSVGQVWAMNAGSLSMGWTLETPPGETAIAVASNGLQMLLDGVGQVWAMNGINYMGSWTRETPAGETAIAAGNVQMILDSVGQVWAQSASTLSMGWTNETPPGIKAISAGVNFQMILDSVGQVWAQTASTLSMSWTQETPGGIKAVSGGGVQMILDSVGQVWAMNTITYMGGWTLETPPGETIISSGSSLQLLIDGAGQVWAQSAGSLSMGWTQETPGGETAIAAG